jgi:ubiquinol-cytochrome c reductase cytochrome c subunit
MKTLLALVVLAAALSAQTQPPSPAQAPLRGDAAKGKVAFMNAGCYTCHGTVGQGGAGARLAPKPRAQAGFAAYVRSGRRGWSVAGGMPAYPPRMLSDEALADIYAYLMSIPTPVPAADNPLLKD